MNLKSHHRRERVVRSYRRALVAMNSPGGYDYCAPVVAQERIIRAIERSAPELDGRKIARMVMALWECDD